MKALTESWYPLCPSRHVKPGRVRSVRAFDADWVVFRRENGAPGILRAHCPHAGANLGLGRVKDGCLVCPMHGWCFGTNGRQGREGIAAEALPVEEYLGVLYGFWGRGAPFPFPKRLPPAETRHSRVWRFHFAAPHQLAGVNAFDIAHLWPVHRRELTSAPDVRAHSPQHISIRYQAAVAGDTLRDALIRFIGLKTLDIEIHSYGGSLLVFEHKKAGVQAYISLLPERESRTRVFLSIARRASRLGWLKSPFHSLENVFFRLFAAEDLKVLENARLETKHWRPETDGPLLRWWEHLQAMPAREVCP